MKIIEIKTPEECPYRRGWVDDPSCLYPESQRDIRRDFNRCNGFDSQCPLKDAEPNWISVEERLPEPGQFVLCTFPDVAQFWCDFVEGEQDGGGKPTWKRGYVVRQLVCDNGHRWVDEGVTHWMPLPQPPKGG